MKRMNRTKWRKITYPLLNDEKQSLYSRWCFQRHFDGDPFLLLTTPALTLSFSLRFTIKAFSFRLKYPYHSRSFLLFYIPLSFRLTLNITRVTMAHSHTYNPYPEKSPRVQRRRNASFPLLISGPVFSLSPSENHHRVHRLWVYKYQNKG